jgi:phage I-like protein
MSIPPRGGAAGKVKIALTPEDKRRAFAMGMSEKDYAAAKARKEGKL